MTFEMLATLALGALLSTSPVNRNAERLTRLLDGFHENRTFNGVVLYAEGERVLVEKAYGFEDFDARKPLKVTTAFEVGSVSKPFTATAILLLAEAGKLSLDDSLTKYFPGLPYEGVTIRGMLSHTSGLFDVCCQPELRPRFDRFYGKSDPPYTNRDYLEFMELEKPALLSEPGRAYSYSNTGYVLLGLIVEKVSGQRFEVYLHDHVLEPLGLESTYVRSRIYPQGARAPAKGYRETGAGVVVEDVPVPTPERPSVFAATYGDDEVVSTVDDLFRFGRALKDGKLLKRTTLDEAWAPVVLAGGDPGPYGLGWRIEERAGHPLVYHTGSTEGFLALCTFPTDESDFTLILLTNVVSDHFADLREAALVEATK